MGIFQVANELLGGVEKMKIQAVDPKKGPDPLAGDDYNIDVQFNPTNFSQSFGNQIIDEENIGTPDVNKYQGTKTTGTTVKFLYDITSVNLLEGKDALKELFAKKGLLPTLQKFYKLFIKPDDKEHDPFEILISWGGFLLRGKVTSIEFEHVLFNNGGFPIRTWVSVSVQSGKDAQGFEFKPESPDLTKIHTVKAGETLGLIAEREYDNPLFYLELAKVNNLNHFRRLKPGMQLILPPINKTA